jgi:hypothetical protein
MLVELGAGEVNAILDWAGMETHVAPQLSPRQATENSARGKLAKPHHTEKSRQSAKHGDKTGAGLHKSRSQNIPAAAPRDKAGAPRGVARSKTYKGSVKP